MNEQYQLNKELAQMLKGGVIRMSQRPNRQGLHRKPERALSWRVSGSLRIFVLRAVYPE